MNGLALLADRFDLSLPDLCAQLDIVVHGTTTADNTMIEMDGAPTGLLVTAGHRDEIEMRRVHKEEIWDPTYPAPAPIARRRARIPIPERMDHQGNVMLELDEEAVRHGRPPPPPARGHVDRGDVPVLVRQPGPRAPGRGDHPGGVPRRRPRLALPRGDGARSGVRAGLHHARQRVRGAADRVVRQPPPGEAARRGVRGPAAHHAGDRWRDAAGLRRPARGHAARERPDRVA